jgi:hypothetical protein
MSTARRLRAPLYALLFSFAIVAGAPPRAAAQDTGAIIVPAPPFIITNGVGTHYAKQNDNNPEMAHDRWTEQDLKWDRAKKSWVDTKTGEALGFDGQLASDGAVIPAPPFINTPGKGLHEAKQEKTAEYNGHGNPELALDNTSNQILYWDREKQSWFDTKWDDGTQSRIETGPALGFNGVAVNANATGTPTSPVTTSTLPTTVHASETGGVGPCPDAENCVLLQQIYFEADRRAAATAQTLTQAQADRENDLAQAAQLDKSASRRGDPDVSKAEQQQAQGLRDKLLNAKANYDAAAKAALDAWQNWQNCLKGLLKDCPPKKPAQAASETGTTNTTGGNTTSATPGPPGQAQPTSNSSLAGDLCERAKALRDIAARDRQMADAAQDQRTKDYLLSDAKMMDGMAKEREDLARHYDPNACPEHATAIPGGNGTASQNGAGSQSAGGASTTPGLVGNGPWILIFPGLPLWNVDEQRWYGQNPDHTPREETSQAGADTWIMIFPGLPLWNTEERRWYGYNPDHSPREDEPPINPYQNPSNSSGSPAPTGGTPAASVVYQCMATTPMLRTEGISELIADIPLNCTGAPPPNSSIGLHSNVPLVKVDIDYKIGGQLFTDHFTPTNNGHRAQVNLPGDFSNASDFKLSLDYAPGGWDMHEHLRFRFDGSPGISINPGGYTAPITNKQVGGFTPSSGWLDEYNRFAPFRVSNEWGESNFPRSYMNFPGYTPTSGRGMNRTPALCTDTTTTTYVPLYNGPLSSSSLGSGFGYSPFPCTLNERRGTLTFGRSNIFDNPWTAAEDRAREFQIGHSAPNTPGGVYNSESGFQVTPNQNGSYLNGGWSQTPQTPWTTPGFTGNGYGGSYNPSPFAFNRPQSYYDDNGPQSRFLIADPWNMRPSYCDYDFPDKLRAFPALAQALAAEARSRRPQESRAFSREPAGAHFQLVSMRSGSPVSNSPSRAAGRAQIGRKPPQVQIEARVLEVAPTYSYSIVSNGKSQGQAFELQVADPTGKLKTVAMRDGTIIEAIKPGVTEPVTAPAGGSVVKQPLNAYCLEFHKPPPAEGTLYRIADQATQEKFSSLRFLDRAAAQMSQNNQFHPDNNPEAYKNTIFQYAAWSTLEGWGQEEFTQHWVERTKENAEDLHVPWTKQMEDTLRNAAPGRWGDISEMMNQAHTLEKASQERANSRQTREQQ